MRQHITQTAGSVPASFKGHAQLVGSTLTITNLTGTIGKDHFAGYGTGTEAGKQFEGGNRLPEQQQWNRSVQPGLRRDRQGEEVHEEVKLSLVAVNGNTGDPVRFVRRSHRDVEPSWNVPAKPSGSARLPEEDLSG